MCLVLAQGFFLLKGIFFLPPLLTGGSGSGFHLGTILIVTDLKLINRVVFKKNS